MAIMSLETYSQIPQTNNLISYYPFLGNLEDQSGKNHNTGSINGDPSLTQNRFGTNNAAYYLDGTDDYLYFGNSIYGDLPDTDSDGYYEDDYTISIWAKSSMVDNEIFIAFGEGDGLYTGMISVIGSTISFNSSNWGFPSTSTSGKKSDNNWHQYTFVYGAGSFRKLFIDGSLVRQANDSQHRFRFKNYGLSVGIGRFDPAGNPEGLATTYTGSVDDVRIWNVALTNTEVSNLYTYENNAANDFSLPPITPFVTTWQTDANTNVTIPLTGSGYDFTIDWGDGTTEIKTGTPGNISHTYSTAGVKTVSITPNIATGFPRIYVNNFGNRNLLQTIESWGSGQWGASVDRAFYGAANLEVNATDIPDFSATTNFQYMFLNCSSVTGTNGFTNWTLNTNPTATISFSNMFQSATLFNGDISNWDVSRVNTFDNMFNNAASFNQNIGSWNVANATNMSSMFRDADAFNIDISGWNVANVTTMELMFSYNDIFNQDLSNWDVSNVTNMERMFGNSVFNSPLNWGIKTGNVTNMSMMFRQNPLFNQDISGWNVSNVITFRLMFYNATNFNQSLTNWQFTNDSNKTIDMEYMFWNATSFDQDIAAWNISRVTNLYGFLKGGELSTANYDALLLGWSTLDAGETLVPINLNAHFGSSKYSNTAAVITARDTDLIASKNWTITDAGMFDSTVFTPTTITGTTTICAGDSTTLTASGGTTNANTVDVWYEGACGDQGFHEGWDTQRYNALNTTFNNTTGGVLNLTSTSNDPIIEMYNLGTFDPSVYKYINFRYRVVSGATTQGQIFFLNGAMTLADGAKYKNTTLISDGQWHTAVVDMSTHPLWASDGNITGIRYDYTTASGVTMDLDFIELSSAPIVGTGNTITVSPTANISYYVNRKGPETNTSCISQLVTVNQIPVITNFNNYSKTYFDESFTIANPTSASAGSFSYTSDNASVATISGNTVTITGVGTANITATQAANGSFCSNTATVPLTVNDVSVVTKYGEISATNSNYVNKYGEIGDITGVSKNGLLLDTNSPFSGGTFDGYTYNLVTTATGRVWLDRNLGATQVASSSTDAASFGDLYQWGRGTDGHEKRTSTSISTVSTKDTPGHGFFINGNSFNWQSPVNTELWQGVDGKNNPCPKGFRLPTIEEFEAEVVLWNSQNAAGALASSLKLPIAGRRHTNGSIYSVGSNGMYRTNSTLILNITSTSAARAGDQRIDGFCVRCIKD